VSYQPRLKLPTEFALAASCCRWAYSGEGAEELRRAAQSADWGKFLETCRRHRVQGLAWQALSSLKIPVLAPVTVALEADARHIAEQGLRSARESVRLAETFSSAGVPLLFLKGLTLGALAYGDPFLKMGWDIDLLVLPHDVGRAATLLEELGYRLHMPRRRFHLTRWHASRKESEWRNPGGLVVELHSRVADQPELLPDITTRSPSQAVNIAPGIKLQTLAAEELFAYLCVHGASSAWFRLKWVADLAGVLHRLDAGAIDARYRRAVELGAGRAAGLAVILVHWLFAVPMPAGLAERFDNSTEQSLARAALKTMLRGEPTDRPFGTATIHFTQFFLLPGLRFKLAEFARQGRVTAGLF